MTRPAAHWTLGAALALAGLLNAANAVAAAPDGAGDPKFRAAVELWLKDDDAASLPRLAAQARHGNVAARLLLGRIEVTERAPSAYVRALSRSQRMALFRPPAAGLFPPTWLRREAENGNALAKALFGGLAQGVDLAAVRRLRAVGEIEATEHLVRKIAVDGDAHQRRQLAGLLAPADDLSPYLEAFRREAPGFTTGLAALGRMVAHADGAPAPGADAAARTAALFVDIGYQAGDLTPGFSQANPYYGAIARWVMKAPQAQPVAAVCRRSCGASEVAACAVTALGLVGGYYEVIRFDSPLEAVIPQQRYLASRRARAMALRRMAFAKTEAVEDVFSGEELRTRSRCLAAAVKPLRTP